MRAQTAIEYLMLIGATVFFVIMVALATRDILLPTGKTILLKNDAVNDKIYDFGASPTPLASICTPFEICTTNLNCQGSCAPDGSYCIDNPSDNCPANPTSQPTVSTSPTATVTAIPTVSPSPTVSPNPTVSPSPSLGPSSCTITGSPSTATGPFTSSITATFTGNFGQKALIKCNDADAGVLENINPPTGIATRNCDYPNQTVSNRIYNITASSNGITCNSTITDLKPLSPFCKITANPSSGYGPLSSTIVANFSGTNHSINVTIRCNQTDAGETMQINFISRLALRTCPYPASVPIGNQTFNISATSNAVFCNGTVVVNQTPPQQCKLTASPSSDIGPFTSILTANFSGTANSPNALIKCNQSDPGISVPVDFTTRIATRICPYPSVNITSQIFTAQATSNGFTCNANITDHVLPVCSTSICQVLTPTFFNFIVYPQLCSGTCLPNILVLDPSTSCNAGSGVCLPTGCKVRGSQDGENICAMIEDWGDYDWNDYSFSTKVTTFPNGDKILRVYQNSCDADALDGLNITFNFSTPKYILDMHYGLAVSQNQEHFLWQRCDNSVGEYRTFFITNNPPSNLPPVWNTDALPPAIPGDPYILNPDPIASGGSTINHDLWVAISDESLDSLLQYSVISQSNPALTNCAISANRYLACPASSGSGRNFVTIRATDPQGLWSEGVFEVVVGAPKINLPNLFTIPVDGDWTIDLRGYSMDSSIFDVPQFLLVNEYGAFVSCQLEPNNYNLHCKYNRIAAKGSKGFSDFVLTGSSMFTSSTAVVEFRVQVV